MFKIFQITLDGIATKYKYSSAASCMDHMRELKKEFPSKVVSFLEIDL